MKRPLCLIVAVCLVAVLAACGAAPEYIACEPDTTTTAAATTTTLEATTTTATAFATTTIEATMQTTTTTAIAATMPTQNLQVQFDALMERNIALMEREEARVLLREYTFLMDPALEREEQRPVRFRRYVGLIQEALYRQDLAAAGRYLDYAEAIIDEE